MNVTYRRSVQQHFAIHLDEGAMGDLQSALDDLAADDAD
jgi:hypothetical protein